MTEAADDPGSTRPKRRRVIPILEDKIQVGSQRLVRARRAPLLEDELAALGEGDRSGSSAPAKTETEAETSPGSASTLPAAPTSFEEVARKHLGSRAEQVIEEHGEFLAALAEDAGPIVTAQDHARRLEVFSETAPVIPDPESNPDKRPNGSVSPIIMAADSDAGDFIAGIGQPETIFDLFNAFPQLDGINWFIYVERKQPRIFSGTKCDGMLRPIGRPITLEEWQMWYGGGEYKLIVYGPPKNGSVVDVNGRSSSRKLTEPITVKFPGPPSFESIVYDDGLSSRGESMTQQQPMTDVVFPPRRGPHTQADATVAVRQIDVADSREKRLEASAKEEKLEKDRLLREQNSAQGTMVSELMTTIREGQARESSLRDQAIQREREMARERRDFEERMEEKMQALLGKDKPDDVDRVIKLANSMGSDKGQLDALRSEHAREVERLQELRSAMEVTHARAVKDERERADQRIKDAEERADRRIKDAEERFGRTENEVRSRAEMEVQRTKDESTRRIDDEHRRAESRIADLDRNHLRDLQSLKDSHVRDIEALKSTYEMRLDVAKGDAKRSQSEADRARADADANKDFVGQLSKFKEQAAAVGMVEASEAGGGDSEPKTIPQMLLEAGTQFAGNLPAMIENFAAITRGKNQQELELARAQARQEAFAQLQGAPGLGQPPQLPGGHRQRARDRRPDPGFAPIDAGRPAPLIPGQPQPVRRDPRPAVRPIGAPGEEQPEEIIAREEEQRRQAAQPVAVPVQQPMHQAPQQHLSQPPSQQQAPAFEQQEFGPPVEPFVPSQPPPAFSTQPPPSNPSAEAETFLAQQHAEDQNILQAGPLLLGHYEAKSPPVALANQLFQANPAEVHQLLAMISSPERISQAFLRQAGPNHPLARRDGKKYLSEIYSELKRLARGGA